MIALSQKNILVTGGAGFIGSHLIDELLKNGHKVICYDNFDEFYDESIKKQNLETAVLNENFLLEHEDILDKNALDNCFKKYKIDIVVHLAAKAGVRPSIENPEEYYKNNLIGTLNLLEAMRKANVKKMIFASSSSVYGNNKKVPFSETDNVDFPVSPYAASKKAAELLCHTYHHLYGFNIFCLRFFTVYGPRQRPDLAIHKFLALMLQNKSIPVFGDGNSSRDYTYIDDIVQGLLSAIDKVNGYEIINLGESQTISLNFMINTLEQVTGIKTQRKYLSNMPGDVITTFADINKAKKILGYIPTWSFEKGIKKFVKWKKV